MCMDMVVRPDKYLIWMSFLPAVEQYEAETFLHPIVVKILEWDRCYVFARSNAKKAKQKSPKPFGFELFTGPSGET